MQHIRARLVRRAIRPIEAMIRSVEERASALLRDPCRASAALKPETSAPSEPCKHPTRAPLVVRRSVGVRDLHGWQAAIVRRAVQPLIEQVRSP